MAKAIEAADETEALTTRISVATAIASEINCRRRMAAARAKLTSDDSGQPRTKRPCPAEQSAVVVAAGTILQSALDPWMTKVLNPAAAVVAAMTAASLTDSTEKLLNEAEKGERPQIGGRGRTVVATAQSLLLTTRGQETEVAPSRNDNLDGVPRRGPSATTRHSRIAAAGAEEVTLRPPRRLHRAGIRGFLASQRTMVAVRCERSDGDGPRTMLAVRRGEAITWTEETKDTKNELPGMIDMAETMPTTKSSEATTERMPLGQATKMFLPQILLGPRTGGGGRRRRMRRPLKAAEPAATRAGTGSGTDPLTERSVSRMRLRAQRRLHQTVILRGSLTKTLLTPGTEGLQPSQRRPLLAAAAPRPGSP